MLGAVMFGHEASRKICNAIISLAEKAAKDPWELAAANDKAATKDKLKKLIGKDVEAAYKLTNKQERSTALNAARAKAAEAFADAEPQEQLVAGKLVKSLEADIVRGAILKEGRRIDGRDTKTVRPIEAMVGFLTAGEFAAAEALGRRVLPAAQAEALRRLAAKDATARGVVSKQQAMLEAMGRQLTSVGETLRQQLEGLKLLNESVEQGRALVKEMTANVDGMSRSSEETSSSILQMVAINNEVSENIHNLTQSVQETTTAIEEMTFSVKEVARNIEDLSTAAEETAASMNEMDVSISQVETNANETSKLSETVSRDAEIGMGALGRTIQGIDRIKDSSRVAAEVIANLGQKINEIGNILTVIDDVAEQTNLLALNAAIIAAQAREHGRGFAVVADEIKALAERTGASTKEIAVLVKTVQTESKNAIGVMNKGVDAVQEGVKLGHEAEAALHKILESAKRSTLMIKAIAQATVEQAKGSKQVTNAISRIAETVQQIALATSEQAKGSEQIMKSAERMRVITHQVERSTEEQSRGGRQVTEAVEAIRDIVDKVNQAQERQLANTQQVSEAAGQMGSTGERARSTTAETERLLAEVAAALTTLSR
ncbi:MAG: chemotaxis protein [Deltaproteobacteria bacterium]|nr:chemotaxis protein [Deltaproteobacteria bacterium]